jgi:hypothetical protein
VAAAPRGAAGQPAGAAPADASTEAAATERVGILELEVEGASDVAAEAFETSVETGLGNAGFAVARRERMARMLEGSGYLEGCLFGPCLRTVYRTTGVRLALVGRILRLGQSYSYVVTLVDTRSGVPTSQATDTCAVCTVDEAVATAAMAVIGLVTGAGAVVTDPDAGPTGDPRAPPEIRAREARPSFPAMRQRVALRRSAWVLTSAAVAAGGLAVASAVTDRDAVSAASAGASGAFLLSAVTVLAVSLRF